MTADLRLRHPTPRRNIVAEYKIVSTVADRLQLALKAAVVLGHEKAKSMEWHSGTSTSPTQHS